jgi:rubrerythrin
MTEDTMTTNKETVATLFELALEMEKAAEALYRDFEAGFAHQQQAADFWRVYAVEEAGHARWLERFRNKLSAEQLSAPADSQMLQNAHQALYLYEQNTSRQVNSLDDAYQMASELESGEINVVFEFLVTHSPEDKETQTFLRDQLKIHVNKLMTGLAAQFDPQTRREIKQRHSAQRRRR